MAKKSTNSPEPDADGILRTGIYQRRIVPEELTPKESEKRLEASFEKLATPRSIQEWLGDWLQHLASIIRPHLDESSRTRSSLDLGDGWKFYRIAEDLPEQVRDAIDCQNEVRSMMCHIGDDDSLTGSLDWVVHTAFRLGRMSEKMKIRPFEPDVVRGQKVLDSAVAGGKLNAALTEKQKKEAVKKVAALLSSGHSQNLACETVARKFGVSKSTISRAYKSVHSQSDADK